MASYVRGQQDGGKRYDQLLGGDGNLVADLRNLMADLLYARFEKARAGFLDRFTLTYSFSAQREERVNQGGNGNPRASVNHEPERTVAHGLQAAAHRAAGRHDLDSRRRRLLRGRSRRPPSRRTRPPTPRRSAAAASRTAPATATGASSSRTSSRPSRDGCA